MSEPTQRILDKLDIILVQLGALTLDATGARSDLLAEGRKTRRTIVVSFELIALLILVIAAGGLFWLGAP